MIEFRTLRTEELEDWFEHVAFVFKEDGKQYFMNHWYNDPWRDIDSIFVAVEDGKILSTVRVFYRHIYFLGQYISMGGIGEVSTRPECRKMGLSTRLLQDAIKFMEDRNINISMLFGTHLNYSRLGWKTNEGHWKVSEPMQCSSTEYKIRPVILDKDLESIKTIYNSYTGDFNGGIVRNDDFYWKMWVGTEFKNGLIAEDNAGSIAGYIFYKEDSEKITVREFGAAVGYEGVFEALTANANYQIKYPSAVKSSLEVKHIVNDNHTMLRLINSFNAGDMLVENTDRLMELINGQNAASLQPGFLFWGIDGF